MMAPLRRPSTFEDLLLEKDPDRLEIINGEIVEKAAPSPDHSWAEGKLFTTIDPFNRKAGGDKPGGWWVFVEIHVGYPRGEIYCHDCAGWRRDRVETKPKQWPVRIRPDWVCEVVSPKHESRDLVTKARVLHTAEVPHYWTLHPEERMLLVHRWARDGYVVVQHAAADETVRAEPFHAIEFAVSVLFDDDE